MICVATGQLKLVVVSSWDRTFVYPGAQSYPTNFSPVHFFKPDVRQHPLFKEASAFDVSLKPGDCLYLPPYFWYQTQSAIDQDTAVVTFNYKLSQLWLKVLFEGLENQDI